MKIIILGGSGLVGSRFIELKSGSFEIKSPAHSELDVLNSAQLERFIKDQEAEIVVNLVAFTNVDGAEEEKDDTQGACYKLNTILPKDLAQICKESNKHLIHISTDYIFDGNTENPYKEDDLPSPVNWYGKTKFLGENEVVDSGVSFTIIRPEMPFSAKFEKKKDIARLFLEMLKEGKEITATSDQKITPTFTDYFANALEKILNERSKGIYHVGSSNFTTPFDFAGLIAGKFGFLKDLIKPVKFDDYNKTRKAKRPQNSFLSVHKFEGEFGDGYLKTVEESVNDFFVQFNT